MYDRPGADVAKRLQGKHRTDKRRRLKRLLYYGSSAVTGAICGLLLGNSWSRQPIILDAYATLPAPSADLPLTPRQAGTSDTASIAAAPSDTDAAQPPVATPRALTLPQAVPGEANEPPAVLPARAPLVAIPLAAVSQPQSPSDAAYIVQVGAFSKAAHATRVVSQLKAKGYEANMLQMGNSGGHVLYRVYIARFNDANRAKAAARAFREQEKKDAYAVRYQPSPSIASSWQR